jgi:hypothetical protein
MVLSKKASYFSKQEVPRQVYYVIKTAFSFCPKVFQLMLLYIPNPEWFVLQFIKRLRLLLLLIAAYYPLLQILECHCYYRVSYLQ